MTTKANEYITAKVIRLGELLLLPTFWAYTAQKFGKSHTFNIEFWDLNVGGYFDNAENLVIE